MLATNAMILSTFIGICQIHHFFLLQVLSRQSSPVSLSFRLLVPYNNVLLVSGVIHSLDMSESL